ncbi:GNAT family N-acetyltransferase [Isoptericola aurantiacus]|uniref:GNAT family N-acetyltransferase n=1 Tax=Isoptericola aurantiacus TaxID=3377839 RepID=UPI00383BAABD
MSTPAPTFLVRPALADDVGAMARIHVRCWQQAYRELVPDHVLDDPGFVDARERLWRAVTTDERYAANRAVVAETDGHVIGIAMTGPPSDDDATWDRQIFVLYLDAAHHGSGAGTGLLDGVLDPHQTAALWVADPNPRAQAFYRKHGFTPDGVSTVEDGVTELRMLRIPTA